MKAIDVLQRADRGHRSLDPDLRGQRLLDQDPVHLRILIESPDFLEQTGFGHIRGEIDGPVPHAHFLGGLALQFDIQLRSRILSDEDRRESRHDPVRGEFREPGLQLCANIVGDLLAVDQFRGHVSTIVRQQPDGYRL